jgi:hypothetical protein
MTMNIQATEKAKPAGKEKAPAKVIRDETDRAIAASIWEREGQEGIPYFTYTISRSYKSKNSGKEGYSGDFYGRNATAIGNVAKKAEAWIAENSVVQTAKSLAA